MTICPWWTARPSWLMRARSAMRTGRQGCEKHSGQEREMTCRDHVGRVVFLFGQRERSWLSIGRSRRTNAGRRIYTIRWRENSVLQTMSQIKKEAMRISILGLANLRLKLSLLYCFFFPSLPHVIHICAVHEAIRGTITRLATLNNVSDAREEQARFVTRFPPSKGWWVITTPMFVL